MAKHEILRIGIDHEFPYHGKLDGTIMEVRRFGDTDSTQPRWFKLREVYVPPDITYRSVIRGYRCHFWVHLFILRRGYSSMRVALNQLTSNGGLGGWKLYVGGVGDPRARDLRVNWGGKRPPRSSEVQACIRHIFARMPEARLERWLATMTPPGWGAGRLIA